jgi:hypothetical protein
VDEGRFRVQGGQADQIFESLHRAGVILLVLHIYRPELGQDVPAPVRLAEFPKVFGRLGGPAVVREGDRDVIQRLPGQVHGRARLVLLPAGAEGLDQGREIADGRRELLQPVIAPSQLVQSLREPGVPRVFGHFLIVKDRVLQVVHGWIERVFPQPHGRLDCEGALRGIRQDPAVQHIGRVVAAGLLLKKSPIVQRVVLEFAFRETVEDTAVDRKGERIGRHRFGSRGAGQPALPGLQAVEEILLLLHRVQVPQPDQDVVLVGGAAFFRQQTLPGLDPPPDQAALFHLKPVQLAAVMPAVILQFLDGQRPESGIRSAPQGLPRRPAGERQGRRENRDCEPPGFHGRTSNSRLGRSGAGAPTGDSRLRVSK